MGLVYAGLSTLVVASIPEPLPYNSYPLPVDTIPLGNADHCMQLSAYLLHTCLSPYRPTDLQAYLPSCPIRTPYPKKEFKIRMPIEPNQPVCKDKKKGRRMPTCPTLPVPSRVEPTTLPLCHPSNLSPEHPNTLSPDPLPLSLPCRCLSLQPTEPSLPSLPYLRKQRKRRRIRRRKPVKES